MNEILWTKESVIEATGGRCDVDWECAGLSIDTRTLQQGDLFLALRGENSDGHDYVLNAQKSGASAALVSKDPAGIENLSIPLVYVDDVLDSLEAMAKYKRERVNAKFFAITGSVGKTGVKEGLKMVLSAYGETHSTEGNLNNHIGLPLSMARMPDSTMFAVYELGMSGKGEISHLSKMVRPDISIITTVTSMHLEFFDSVEGIAHAKSEIFDGMPSDGIAIIPQDNEYFDILKKNASSKGVESILSFGRSIDSNILLKKEKSSGNGQELFVAKDGKDISYEIGALGPHQAINSVIILSAIMAAKLDINIAINQMKNISATKGRGKLYHVEAEDKKFTLLDDSYNAGPLSMEMAFNVAGEIKKQKGVRVIALLGDMLELGPESPKMHEELANPLKDNNIDLVFTVGDMMVNLSKRLPDGMNSGHFDSPDSMYESFKQVVKDNDLVLVKGSHGTNVWKICDKLTG